MKFYAPLFNAFILIFSVTSFAAGESVVSTGLAYKTNGELAYKEKHTLKVQEDRILTLKTEYFDQQEKPIGYLKSNFVGNPYLPIYTFYDDRLKKEAGIEKNKSSIVAFSKPSKEQPKKKQTFKNDSNMIAGQGLLNYIMINFDNLVATKDKTRVQFLMPQNLDTYTFRIYAAEVKDKEVIFNVEFKNWFIRLIAPRIVVTFDRNKKRLRTYEGPSNLSSLEREMYDVKILYSYEDEQNIAMSALSSGI